MLAVLSTPPLLRLPPHVQQWVQWLRHGLSLLCLQRLITRSTFVFLVTLVAVLMVGRGGGGGGGCDGSNRCCRHAQLNNPRAPLALPLPLQPSFSAVVGLVGSVSFFPLSIFFPMAMWIKVGKKGGGKAGPCGSCCPPTPQRVYQRVLPGSAQLPRPRHLPTSAHAHHQSHPARLPTLRRCSSPLAASSSSCTPLAHSCW